MSSPDFIFDNEWYLQVGGTAMGKIFAPNYANIFMAQWEKKALEKCLKNPSASSDTCTWMIFFSYGCILRCNSLSSLIFLTLTILA